MVAVRSKTRAVSGGLWRKRRTKIEAGRRCGHGQLSYLPRFANGLPANCWSIFCINRAFLISKLPHSVLNPPSARSSDSWLKIVVFPEPVGPVMTVSSPRLSPLMMLVNRGKDLSAVPLYWSGFCKDNKNTAQSEPTRMKRVHAVIREHKRQTGQQPQR